jgi:predicted lipoprotein with Yx(FWY)xxD motif
MKGELRSRAGERVGARSRDELHIGRVPYYFTLKQAALTGGTLALAVVASGCWMAAMQMAPLAIQAVETVGGGVTSLAEGGTMAAHHADKNMPAADSDICDELSLEIPMLIELRTDATGVTRYRELSLAGADLDPQWAAMPNQDTKNGGWKLASNFTKMNFQPPLQSELTANSIAYVAYAASDARDATEQDQLNALAIGFGPNVGTFTWNERAFRYALVHKLPCFPPPPEPRS